MAGYSAGAVWCEIEKTVLCRPFHQGVEDKTLRCMTLRDPKRYKKLPFDLMIPK